MSLERMMAHTCLMLADGGRARFFAVALPEDEDFEQGPRLRECSDPLVNPEGLMTGTELFANVKSGRNRAPAAGPGLSGKASAGSGPAHGLDDHRARHEREIERRFAKRVAETAAITVKEQRSRRLIVVAAPQMLGQLREPLSKELPDDVELEEVGQDLSWHALPQVEKALEKNGLIEPRTIPASVYRPAGQPPRQ
jgi:protein required for attachment to host cells